jgi:hypothetical protein
MGDYVRKGNDSPTPQEIEKGYAPSTIRGTPFAKFLFWTFGGLAITYAVTYGVTIALDKIQEHEDARYASLSTRGKPEFRGIPLQPSRGHAIVDWEETALMYDQNNKDLVGGGGWTANPAKPWRTQVSEEGRKKTEEALKQLAAKYPSGAPAATNPASGTPAPGGGTPATPNGGEGRP